MSALVTGACGFVGSRLVARLAEAGEEVVAVDDLSLGRSESLPAGVELAALDVRDTDGLGRAGGRSVGPQTVFHLAAIHFVPACNADPPAALSVNVVGTQSLLTALERAHLPESLVLASTGAVYEPSTEAHHEDSPLGARRRLRPLEAVGRAGGPAVGAADRRPLRGSRACST